MKDLFNRIPFYKMEGIGNDYIYFDFSEQYFSREDINELEIPYICNRRTGVGSDGIVVMSKTDTADIKMLMWNSDGSTSDVCGNALRCVGFYWYKKTQKKDFFIESGAGKHHCIILNDYGYSGLIQISMNQPIFEAEKIPYKGSSKISDISIFENTDFPYRGYVLSMGNPHCIFFVEDPDNINIEKWGPYIENHPMFPERTNIEFVSIKEDGTMYQRTWERGSGETLACGSGACAVLVASVMVMNLPRKNKIHLKGGDLELEWSEQIYMKGLASFVFYGFINENYKLFR